MAAALDPYATDWLDTFLEPSFRDSRYFHELAPTDGRTGLGLLVGALIGLAGIAVAYRVWGRDLLLVRLLQVALAAGSCALVAVVGRRVAGPVVGLLAAFAFALYKPDIFYVAEVDKTIQRYWLQGIPVIGHNVGYDFTVLDAEIRRFKHGHRVLRLGDHVLTGDEALLVFLHEKAVEGYHPEFGPGLNIGVDAECLVVTDQGRHGWSIDHDFENGHPPGLVDLSWAFTHKQGA